MSDNFFEPEVTESIMPSDDTPSLGSNYGLDGFQFDSEYGEGVLDGGRLPEVQGLSALPDGLMHTAAPYDYASGVMLGEPEGSYHGTDLSEMLEENSLAGLGWLHGEQDPDRLPKNPVDRSIMELEKAWGVHDRTTGLLIPNKVYRAPDNDPHHEGFERVDAGDMIKLVKQAMRRSAYGHPLNDILKAVALPLQSSARKQIACDMRRLADDHGLRGKVFIEAVAFPGLKKGKFASEIHRYCAAARYVLVPKSMDQNTRSLIASVTGKIAVTQVPWQEAFNFYAPRLQSTGHRVASTSQGDFRTRLKLTLASKERVAHESTAPVQVFAVDQLSISDAKRKFARMVPEGAAAPTDPAQVRHAKEMFKVKERFAHWNKAGLLDSANMKRILKASLSPREMFRMASEVISESKEAATYTGAGEGQNSVREQFHRPVATPVNAAVLRKAKWVMQQMNEGWAGKRLSALIRKKFAGKTASAEITNLRKAHEGLAGFVYVDASVYASDKGSKGCDAGALHHRANNLRYVLAMDRCTSCVQATEGKCQKYGKTLLDSSDGLEKVQRKNLKACDMTDAEDTGSLFAPTYNQDEYGLQYDDDVDLDDEFSSEVLDGVLMDGLATTEAEDDVYGGIDLDEVGF